VSDVSVTLCAVRVRYQRAATTTSQPRQQREQLYRNAIMAKQPSIMLPVAQSTRAVTTRIIFGHQRAAVDNNLVTPPALARRALIARSTMTTYDVVVTT